MDATLQFRIERAIAVKGVFDETLRGIAIDAADRIYAVGDKAVRVFDRDGALLREWPLEQPGHAVAVDGAGQVWVGQSGQVQVYTGDGKPLDTWRPEILGLVTAIGFGKDDVFLGDAEVRWIHRFDRAGNLINHIGDKHRKGGFHIPNGAVDFVVDAQSIVHVANPGMHRVERYAADGTLLGHFGRFDGQNPAGFPGCCNPTNVALDAGGRVIVSEKAAPRAKLYDADGRLLTVIADSGFDPAAKNMDLAVDSAGRIYVADTAALEIHVFTVARGVSA